MGLISTLKWLYDPRTDEQKAYDEWNEKTPIQCRTQDLYVFIRGREEPFVVEFTKTDEVYGDFSLRWASNYKTFISYLEDWIEARWTKGIHVDGVWYSPEMIERIELGESKLEVLE